MNLDQRWLEEQLYRKHPKANQGPKTKPQRTAKELLDGGHTVNETFALLGLNDADRHALINHHFEHLRKTIALAKDEAMAEFNKLHGAEREDEDRPTPQSFMLDVIRSIYAGKTALETFRNMRLSEDNIKMIMTFSSLVMEVSISGETETMLEEQTFGDEEIDVIAACIEQLKKLKRAEQLGRAINYICGRVDSAK